MTFNDIGTEKMTLRTMTLAAAAIVAATTASAYAQDLPEGSGKAELVATCSVCHGLDQVVVHRMSHDEWTQKVNSMRGFGAEGTDEDFAKIVEYLSANFSNAPRAGASAKASTPLAAAKR